MQKESAPESSKVPDRGVVEEADVRLVGVDLVFSCSRKKILLGDLGGRGLAAGGPSLRNSFFEERSMKLFFGLKKKKSMIMINQSKVRTGTG
jgi:hypothetical protein